MSRKPCQNHNLALLRLVNSLQNIHFLLNLDEQQKRKEIKKTGMKHRTLPHHHL
jgi:hypothetical protein